MLEHVKEKKENSKNLRGGGGGRRGREETRTLQRETKTSEFL